MKLSDLIKECSLVSSDHLNAGLNGGDTHDPDIVHIASNSGNVKPKGLFIAVKGLISNGHDYIDQAFENGAAAVIAQSNPKNLDNVILVENSRKAMASIAANFYKNPSKKMTLVGITGTNGKTTTAWLLESIFKACGFSTGVIGTVNIRYSDKVIENPITTPDSIDLQKNLFKMEKAGVSHVIMEVSSHGLDLNRVDFCLFDAGIFTNLSQDHLDYHKNIDQYFKCKKTFFTRFLGPNGKNSAPAILNIDDPKGKLLGNCLNYKTIKVSTKEKSDISAQKIKSNILGLSATICLPHGSFDFTSQLTGWFNMENILCAAGAAHALNVDPQHIQKGIENCSCIPGRLEKIDNTIDRFLFVDYAHTPDALESTLTTLKQNAPERIITVFGCGGDRDSSKRPVMGQIACKHSDTVIVTSDNPRTEHPEAIIDDIFKAINEFDSTALCIIEPDRKKALKKAIIVSKPEDIIIVAGKGHETYQITNNGIIDFDDRKELEKAAKDFACQFKPIEWTGRDLAKALNTEPVVSNIKESQVFSGISTDSRIIKKNQVFLALKGENFDGHAFIKELIDKGIKGFIIESKFFENLDEKTKKRCQSNNLIIFQTQNTLTALGQLARHQRLRSNVKLLAITGSSGKTTTRKIAENIFQTQFYTHATTKNFNNEIGLPLTLLNLSAAHEWAIVEMGMNHPGEISKLTETALPDIAMITNTADVHLEGLGNAENVAKAKAEIFKGLRKNSTALIYGDDSRRHILEKKARENKNIKKIVFFGSGNGCEIQSKNIQKSSRKIKFSTKIKGVETALSINSPASFMVDNCLAAICAAQAAAISAENIKQGIKAFTPVSGRMHLYPLSDFISIIDDTYNANPDSMTKALATLQALSRGKNSIAILGDMLELGQESERLHRQIGHKTAQTDLSKLFLFGSQVKQIIKGAVEKGFLQSNIFHGTKDQIVQKVLEKTDTATWILVKGSRGMNMETVIHKLKHRLKMEI